VRELDRGGARERERESKSERGSKRGNKRERERVVMSADTNVSSSLRGCVLMM
jgi:hypothetical protein